MQDQEAEAARVTQPQQEQAATVGSPAVVAAAEDRQSQAVHQAQAEQGAVALSS